MAPWTGLWPGVAECRALGLYCRDLHADGSPVTDDNWESERGKVRFHVPCGPDDPGAHEDLNRYELARQK